MVRSILACLWLTTLQHGAGHEVAGTAEAILNLSFAAEQDSECSDKATVSKESCLSKSTKCMFLELDKRNLCVPCEWGGAVIPCVPQGAAYPQGTVRNCEMSCEHKQVVSKVSDCTDVSGDINTEDCYAKGSSAGISCMWTAYTRRDGTRRTMCGPCKVDGLGVVGRYTPGSIGPEPGSMIEASFSQCEDRATGADKPCFDPAGCPKRQPPMPPQKGDKPHIVDVTRLGLNFTLDAPKYYAAAVSPPFGVKEFNSAAKVAAKAAGWEAPTQIKSVDRAVVAPKEGPLIPQEFAQRPIPALPGLLFPVPAFKTLPGHSSIQAEPRRDTFTPKIVLETEALLETGATDTRRKFRGLRSPGK
mmetsp:Transcript_89037/g.157712  ORF Transcript_89037/g.157712 Transcript_89037/m.157712 type:complete len:359 (+) Transcript_89037:98-1174(+)